LEYSSEDTSTRDERYVHDIDAYIYRFGWVGFGGRDTGRGEAEERQRLRK